MEWQNTLTVSYLFLTHDIAIIGPNDEYVIVHIPSLREQFTNSFYGRFLQLFDSESMKAWSHLWPDCHKSDILKSLIAEPTITNIKEFAPLSQLLTSHIKELLPHFHINERELYSDETKLTDDIVDEILFVLSQGMGKTVERPQHFGPDEEAARKFYEQAKLARDKAREIREHAVNNNNHDSLMDMFVLISLHFPYTFEQMYDMTMMQLHYLQHMSSRILSYTNGMMAYSAGNLKKAPEFFLK